jgi:4-oxalocrotonate tautomerase
MPHIDIKCYPKHLTEDEYYTFIHDLTHLVMQSLHVSESDVSINYTELPPDEWKREVWDKEIAPNIDRLAKKPGYSM